MSSGSFWPVFTAMIWRFDYTEIPQEKITVISDIGEAVSWLAENAVGEILAVTCFSDKGKFLSHVQTQKEAKS